MLSPEVVNFPLGKTSRKWARVGRIADGDSGSPWASAAKCAAATVVKDLRVFLPEALHPPEALLSELLHDKEFYRMGPVVNIGVLAACLVDREFVATFVKNGQFCLSARSTEWTLSVNPSGTLTLEGPLTTSTMTCRRGPAFQTDLKSCLEKGTLNSARRALTNLLTTLCEGVEFTVVEFMWRPEEPSVCPSTIAKYFHSSLDGVASVEEVRPELTLLRREPPLGLIPIISFGEDDDDDVGTCPFGVADHENVLGAIQLGLDEYGHSLSRGSFLSTSSIDCPLCFVPGLLSPGCGVGLPDRGSPARKSCW